MRAEQARELLGGVPSMRRTGGPEEYAAWSARLRGLVRRLARADRAPLAVTEGEPVVREGLRRVPLTLERPGGGGRFRATLLVPLPVTGSGAAGPAAPGPAVLVCAGRNVRLDQVTGDAPPDHPDRDVARQLAAAGFTTLTFDYGLDGGLDASRLDGRDEGTLLAHAYALTGRSLLGALVADALGALDVLSAQPSVDRERVGLFGHSLGAGVALHTALLADRPLPLCTASHLGSYPVLYGRLLAGHEGAVLPGILEYADLPDLYAALAPAPLHVQYGTADPFLDPADSRDAGAAVLAAHGEAPGTAGAEVHEIDMSHGTHIGRATEFFIRTLAATALTNGTTNPGGDGAHRSTTPVPAQRVHFGVADRRAVLDRVDAALVSGVLTQGPQVARFEKLCAPWTGAGSVAVASGSAALEIALRTIGVAGRTVLVPVNTFFATAAAAARAEADVRFVDVELDGLGMDPAGLKTALERYPDTAAVVPVHIGGIVSPSVDEVLDLCAGRGIPVLEDAAHAFGSTLTGRPAGSLGRFGAFSFFPTKVAVSGEGGLVTGADGADLEEVRRWRDHGKSAPGSTLHDRPGGNWRMSELHAAVGTVDVERFAATLAARRTLAARYDDLLASVPGLRPHMVPDGAASNFYKYLAYPDRPLDRDLLKKRLRERHGVSLAGEVYDHLLTDHPYFAGRGAGGTGVGAGGTGATGDGPFPRGRWFARHHLALPLYPTLTEAEQIRVVSALSSELS